MLNQLAVLVAAQEVDTWLDALSELGDRLRSNPARFIVAALIGATVFGSLIKKSGAAVLAGLGTFWLSWHVYNTLSGNTTPLLMGERSTGYLWDISFNSNWAFAFFALALVALGLTAAQLWDKGVLAKFLAVVGGIGAWSAVMLLYIMAFVPVYQAAF